MLSPWIIRTLTLPPLLASLIPRTFRRYHTPTIYLPQNSHHTYLLWHFHSHSEIYCHATFHHSIYHDTFIIVILHIPVVTALECLSEIVASARTSCLKFLKVELRFVETLRNHFRNNQY